MDAVVGSKRWCSFDLSSDFSDFEFVERAQDFRELESDAARREPMDWNALLTHPIVNGPSRDT